MSASVSFDTQPSLRGELVELRPLRADDYAALSAAAADPLIWQQHPESNRHEEPVFRRFFREALDSGGALVILERSRGAVIGTSRYQVHPRDAGGPEVEIGWTFLTRPYWGGRVNGEVKRLMLRHAFQFVDRVIFLVGRSNIRSQRALERLGAVRAGVRADDAGHDGFVYEITAAAFIAQSGGVAR